MGRRDGLILDGGLATTLAGRGVDVTGPLWSARALADHPREVLAAHRAFVDAGAEVLTTATYQATVDGLLRHGVGPSQAWRVMAGSVALARGAAEQADVEVVVAASSGTRSALDGPGGEYRPSPAHRAHAALVAFHRERARILLRGGPDVLLFETLPGVREVRAVVEVAEALGHAAWVSVTTSDGRRTIDGEPLGEVAAAVDGADHVTHLGVNCCPPSVVSHALDALGPAGRPLLAAPNLGARWDGGAWRPRRRDEVPDDIVRGWWTAGARVVGGCCGSGPGDVARIAHLLRPSPPTG